MAAQMNSAGSGVDTPLVDRESVVPLPPRRPAQTAPVPQNEDYPVFQPHQLPPAAPARSAADRAFVGTLTAIAAILGSRLLLLLAVAGSFVLAFRAGDNTGLMVLIAYCVLTVIPLVALDVEAHRRGAR